jgi:hypothetical protein
MPKFNVDRIYHRLGEFIATFQWFEDLLLDMVTHLVAREHHFEARPAFANMRFSEKVRVADVMFPRLLARIVATDQLAAAWEQRFSALVRGFDELNTRRNKLVHSSYVELKAGGELVGMFRSKMRLKAGKNRSALLDQGDPLADLDAAMKFAASLAIEAAMAAKQIAIWHDR